MDSMEKFEEKQMPEIDHFYSSLTGENISEDDYNFGVKLWEKFK